LTGSLKGIALLDKFHENCVNAVASILPSRVYKPIMTKNEFNLPPVEFEAKFGG
jgi:hypothetical protein